MKTCRRLLCQMIGAVIAFGIVGNAAAITIDEFNGAQAVVPVGQGAIQTSVVEHPSAMGGTRMMSAEILDGSSMSLVVDQGRLSQSQGAGVKGEAILSWDGDLNQAGMNYTGLGGLDFTDDAGTAIRLFVKSFDFPYGTNSVSFVVTAYDAADASGGKFSQATFVLNHAVGEPPIGVGQEMIEIPFAQFSQHGPNGAVDFRNIGALTLLIDGRNKEIDLQIERITTNGTCTFVPRPGQVIIDECGVCGGDNSSCSDCQGVPNGPALPGTLCTTSNPGACRPGQYDAGCACAALKSPERESCDQIDNDCDGQTDEILDACGVCGGDGKSCLGCVTTDQTALLTDMDGLAKRQEAIIKRLVKSMVAAKPNDPANKKYAADTLKRAHFLQIENWTDSWRLPQITTTCSNLAMCTSVSVEPILARYRERATELHQIGRAVSLRMKKFKKKVKLSRAETVAVARVETVYAEALTLASSVPDAQSTCTTFAAADR